MPNFSNVVLNFQSVQKRYDTLDGKKYLVVPGVLLTEGVHIGSHGAKYYPASELSKFPQAWDHKPVVVNHPTLNGNGISACDPSVIQQQRVGLIFKTNWESKLKFEAWLDEEKLKSLSPKIMDQINQNKMVEISTGLYHDYEETSGTWNGKKYDSIVRNIIPDHLAILTDEKGACSIEDGGGLLRNSNGDDLSYADIRCQLQKLLSSVAESLSSTVDNGMEWAYVIDVYKTYAIYDKGDDTYQVNYKIKKGVVSLDGEAKEVKKVTTYVTTNGIKLVDDREAKSVTTPINNNVVAGGAGLAETVLGTPPVVSVPNATTRKPQVDQMIGTQGWVEQDRDFLTKLSDDDFVRMTRFSGIKSTPVVPITVAPAVPVIPAVPAQNQAQTLQQYIDSAPQEVREILVNHLALQAQEKTRLISIITNKSPEINQKWLAEQKLDLLKAMASLAGGHQHQPSVMNHYAPQEQIFITPANGPTANRQEEQTLPIHSILCQDAAK